MIYQEKWEPDESQAGNVVIKDTYDARTVYDRKSEWSLSEGPPSSWLGEMSSLGERPPSPTEGGSVMGDDYRIFYTGMDINKEKLSMILGK